MLAESTVKTHMSHIYAKLEVSGRQEMMDLLFAEERARP
nr:LuxR C-terminal-related transcriptional regulator [Arabiibacter massiliensis]